MAVAVANPRQCCIVEPSSRRGLIFAPRNSRPPFQIQHYSRQNRRKRRGGPGPAADPAAPCVEDPWLSAARKLAAGSVKILKRGEELPQMMTTAGVKGEKVVEEKVRGGLRKQGRERYAGAASFSTSPPPSALPMPGFLRHKSVA